MPVFTERLIAVDVGNSHTVVGLFVGNELARTYRLSTKSLRTSDELRLELEGCLRMDGFDPRSFSHLALASVVPASTLLWKQCLPHGSVTVIDSNSKTSFSNQTLSPSQVGADRIVNAEAAFQSWGAPLIIMDSGTATTLCAINRKREYLGGAILPGIEGSMEALTQRTALLTAVTLEHPERAIGRDTTEALRSGLVLGYTEMLDGMVRRFKTELNEPNATVIATGGVSIFLKGLLKEVHHYDPDLTLRGIRLLFERKFSERSLS